MKFEFESDWKLFKQRVDLWEERYVRGLLDDYAKIIAEDTSARKRFWKLEDRIYNDKKLMGVSIDFRRSAMMRDMIILIKEGAIDYGDLEGFSDKLVSLVKSHFSDDLPPLLR